MTQNELRDLTVQEKRELKSEEGTRVGPHFEPHVDIYETQGALTVVADVPGAKSDNLEINLHDNVLTLTSKVADPDKKWRPIYEEYRVGHYSRQFRIGHQIDQTKIGAKMKDGVLQLTLPKTESALPRKIRVESVDA